MSPGFRATDGWSDGTVGVGWMLVSVLAALLPVGAYLTARAALDHRLPAELPTHFSGAGADEVASSGSFAGAVQVGIGIGLAIAAIGFLMIRAPRNTRRVLIALGGTVSAVAVATWIASALSAVDRESALGAQLGPGVLIVFLALPYGLLPALLLRRGGRKDEGADVNA